MDNNQARQAARQELARRELARRGESGALRSLTDRLADGTSKFLDGVTFGYSDEIKAGLGSMMGMGSYDDMLAWSESRAKQFEKANPALSPVLEIGGAVATAITPVGALGQIVGSPLRAANVAKSTAAGAGYGALYGTGTSSGGVVDRLTDKNTWGNAGIGAVGGAAAPLLQAGASRLLGTSRGASASRQAKEAGLSKPAHKLLTETATSDEAFGGTGNIRAAGPNAMFADAGPASRELLDGVANHPAGSPIARRNVQGRVDQSAGDVTQALDSALGAPRGVRDVASEISGSTAQARGDAYQAAYASPIDYATESGRRIEEILTRIPPRALREAVEEANEDMIARGISNQQILIDIGEDGAMTFREMPNVQQLDEIKKALQQSAREAVDQFGRPTGRGIRSGNLARELRDALGDAVPEYSAATAAGGDKIAQDQALELGRGLLARGTTVEDVMMATQRMQPHERTRAAQGVRGAIDEMMGNVQRAMTDPNMNAREALSVITSLSKRNNRDKLAAVLGERAADDLLRQIDQAARSFDLRASMAGNSRTSSRQVARERIDAAASGGVDIGNIRPVEITALPSVAMNFVRGRTASAAGKRSDKVTQELAEKLTGLRGADAVALFEQLVQQQQALQAIPQGGGRLSQMLARPVPLAAAPSVSSLIQN